ncbi:MAG TPA: c-type cytochrome [Gemmatimonadales bacterium]|jgi:mono/diheme cytochrome c family protein|nr:c-type cytochrome [Gemmatimonadales bacterium]
MMPLSRGRALVLACLLVVLTWRGARTQQAAATAPDSITPAMVALGDSVFHGAKGGGTCAVCHGADAKGTSGLAPGLIKAKWLHGDGSYAFIVGLVQQGVPQPKEAPTPMPPMGGANLSPEQVRGVAAYVYGLNHPAKKRSP